MIFIVIFQNHFEERICNYIIWIVLFLVLMQKPKNKQSAQHNKEEVELSELDKSHETVFGKMEIETCPVLVLDTIIALRSKSYCFSYTS